jgi:hypothetical protein
MVHPVEGYRPAVGISHGAGFGPVPAGVRCNDPTVSPIMRSIHLIVLCLCLLPLFVFGCVKDTPQSTSSDSSADRLDQSQPPADATAPLRERVAELTRISRRLPGDSTAHRELMAQAFDQMAQALPYLHPEGQNGAYRQRLRILETTRDRLQASSEGIVAPTIDSGLRAMYAALRDIAAQRFADDQTLQTMLEDLDSNLRDLDASRRTTHPYVASRAVGKIRDILSRMLGVLSQPNPAAAPQAAE